MRPFKLAALAVLVVSASFCAAQSSSQTGLQGVIKIGPTQPGPIKADTPASKPFANATFVIQNDKGTVTSFTTDVQGRFRVSLEPGHYTVAKKGDKPAIGNYGPFPVQIVAGKMTEVEWQCDSGIR